MAVYDRGAFCHTTPKKAQLDELVLRGFWTRDRLVCVSWVSVTGAADSPPAWALYSLFWGAEGGLLGISCDGLFDVDIFSLDAFFLMDGLFFVRPFFVFCTDEMVLIERFDFDLLLLTCVDCVRLLRLVLRWRVVGGILFLEGMEGREGWEGKGEMEMERRVEEDGI